MRLRTTMDVTIPSTKLNAFKSAVMRFAPHEHNPGGLSVDYVTVAPREKDGAYTAVHVLIDVIAHSDFTEEAEMAAFETVTHALIYVDANARQKTKATCEVIPV